MRNVYLLRHAESHKNVEDRHGGGGRGLTSLGIEQAKAVCSELNRYKEKSLVTYCTPLKQVLDTCDIIQEELSTGYNPCESLNSLNLGVLSGLSNSEAKQLYPESFNLMKKWRNGNLHITDLKIPEAEPLDLFINRGIAFVHEKVYSVKSDVLIVGTRSILILILNILTSRKISDIISFYRIYEFNNASLTKVILTDENFGQIKYQNFNVKLDINE